MSAPKKLPQAEALADGHVRYLILPTIAKMKEISCARLEIRIKKGKASFTMIPETKTDAGKGGAE